MLAVIRKIHYAASKLARRVRISIALPPPPHFIEKQSFSGSPLVKSSLLLEESSKGSTGWLPRTRRAAHSQKILKF